MLVLVTGGTGFLGSHSVAALTRAGHTVRLLARVESRVAAALDPLGVDRRAVQVQLGEVSDEASVARAARGVDAVLHAASVYSFDSRDRRRMRTVNARGTEVVIGAGRRAGADPIIHISTFGVLRPHPDGTVSADSAVGQPREAYMATKAQAEAIARRHQDEGAPVVISYPAATLGPHDPHLGDQLGRLRTALRGLMPMWPTGGFPIGDVRDLAALHAALVSDRRGVRRVIAPGSYVSTREYVQALREATGRPLPTVFVPAAALLPFGWLADIAQHAVPWHLPVEYGAIYACATAPRLPADRNPFGIATRPLLETMTDSVRWLYETGRLTSRQAGRAASPSPATARP